MAADDWMDVGAAAELAGRPVQQVTLGRTKIALVFKDGEFSAISGVCNHVGGPLGRGLPGRRLRGLPLALLEVPLPDGRGRAGLRGGPGARPRRQGRGRPRARQPGGGTKRGRKPHAPHPLARPPRREPGPIRVLGLSTTTMTPGHPRYSTSEDLLEHALAAVAGSDRARRGCCASAT
jgi:hypothetical protein